MRMLSSVVPSDWRGYLRVAFSNLLPRGWVLRPLLDHPCKGSALLEPEQMKCLTMCRHHSLGLGASVDREGGVGGETVNEFDEQYRKLAPLTFEEKVIILDFVSIALLWFFRDPKGESSVAVSAVLHACPR
jgi:hypothetical protein